MQISLQTVRQQCNDYKQHEHININQNEKHTYTNRKKTNNKQTTKKQ